jgi:glyoxylase-like metal-dependent hydrolase (beta-lactamase superfamily II)
MLDIFTLTFGQLETNCYIVGDRESSDCLIIDPADEGDLITQKILDEKLHPTAIILTHGHFDHVLACLEVKLNFDIPVHLHPLDNFLLKQAQKSARHFLGLNVDPVPPADLPLADDQVISLGAENLKVLHTPGHTPGSICLIQLSADSCQQSAVFTGDTLFSDAVGRTDLSYSSSKDLQSSLKKLSSRAKPRDPSIPVGMTQDPLIYPGHGPSCPISSSALYRSNPEPLDL